MIIQNYHMLPSLETHYLYKRTMPNNTTRGKWQWAIVLIFTAFIAIKIGVLWIHEATTFTSTSPAILLQTNATIVTTIHHQDPSPCCAESTNEGESSSFVATMGLKGNVSDCCCSFSDVERVNLEIVHPLLQKVVQTPFFSHFKMDLCTTCQLWDDAPLCLLRDCGVCECEDPPPWATDQVDWLPPDYSYSHVAQQEEQQEHVVEDQIILSVTDQSSKVDWTADPLSFLDAILDDDTPSKLVKMQSEKDGNSNAVVVDLKLNPERYTGYSGQSAEKVWSAIHKENCFHSSSGLTGETCSLTPEQRVYNRIISGLHSSISLQIAHSYCLEIDSETFWECKTWGPNATLARDRVLSHPDRLENLYAAFAMTLRAVQKAGSAVTAAVPVEDSLFLESLTEWTDSLLPELNRLEHNCPVTFDESSLFSGFDSDGPEIRSKRSLELQQRFRHLQQIMECVGCDRCKLWGTLQALGIGTAWRVLLYVYDDVPLELSRQEAVALVHTLERLSSSLVYAKEFSREMV